MSKRSQNLSIIKTRSHPSLWISLLFSHHKVLTAIPITIYINIKENLIKRINRCQFMGRRRMKVMMNFRIIQQQRIHIKLKNLKQRLLKIWTEVKDQVKDIEMKGKPHQIRKEGKSQKKRKLKRINQIETIENYQIILQLQINLNKLQRLFYQKCIESVKILNLLLTLSTISLLKRRFNTL